VVIAAWIQLGEPWDWNPPTVGLAIDEADARDGWPLRCVITSASDVEPALGSVHPNLPNGSQRLVGQTAELKLRDHHDVPPGLGDRPTVYLFMVVPEIRPETVLIGYGVLETTK
jgi:hypothetical protein